MNNQITNTIMMIRPVAFHRNEQTAVNNYYQKTIEGLSKDQIQQNALAEFDGFVQKLRAAGVEVIVVEDTAVPETPDSIFPNNWISFHESGEVILYPMFAENRRLERRQDIIDLLGEKFQITKVSDYLLNWESQGKFLEGTGSLILDRQNQIAYAATSLRTDHEVLADFSGNTGFDVVVFEANQAVGEERLPIYHTNVMMCVGEKFAVVCTQSIDNEIEKDQVIHSLQQSGKDIVIITEEQKERFAGNMLQVKNKSGRRFVVMSDSAFQSLEDDQKAQLSKHGELLHSSLDTIECLGGGSARCMMAEVFLSRK